MTEPTPDNYIRKFEPIADKIISEKNRFIYQKPGILELCEDVLNNNNEKTKLPKLDESLSIMLWIKNMFKEI